MANTAIQLSPFGHPRLTYERDFTSSHPDSLDENGIECNARSMPINEKKKWRWPYKLDDFEKVPTE